MTLHHSANLHYTQTDRSHLPLSTSLSRWSSPLTLLPCNLSAPGYRHVSIRWCYRSLCSHPHASFRHQFARCLASSVMAFHLIWLTRWCWNGGASCKSPNPQMALRSSLYCMRTTSRRWSTKSVTRFGFQSTCDKLTDVTLLVTVNIYDCTDNRQKPHTKYASIYNWTDNRQKTQQNYASTCIFNIWFADLQLLLLHCCWPIHGSSQRSRQLLWIFGMIRFWR